MKPQFFIDTADLKDIGKARKLGIFSGCTTNPKIVFSTMGNVPYEEGIKKILEFVPDWPVSIEVTTQNPKGMVEEAKKYRTWGKNVVIKLPITSDGLEALSYLSKEKVPTNVTLGMTTSQALMAAIGNATYFSLFYCRIRDSGADPQAEIARARSLLDKTGLETKIIVGSIRKADDVVRAVEAGAHILTIPPKIVAEMLYHPQTERAETEFLDAWKSYQGSSTQKI